MHIAKRVVSIQRKSTGRPALHFETFAVRNMQYTCIETKATQHNKIKIEWNLNQNKQKMRRHSTVKPQLIFYSHGNFCMFVFIHQFTAFLPANVETEEERKHKMKKKKKKYAKTIHWRNLLLGFIYTSTNLAVGGYDLISRANNSRPCVRIGVFVFIINISVLLM